MKKTIILITLGAVCFFIGLSMIVTPPEPIKRDFADVSIQKQKDEKEAPVGFSFNRTDYKIKNVYTNNIIDSELVLADGQYSLISIEDFEKIFFAKVKNESNTVNINKNIYFVLDEKKLYAHEAKIKDKKLIAEYKIPFPATKINGKTYLPLRTAARILGYGVRFDYDNGLVYVDRTITVDDANLIFVRYKDLGKGSE